MTIDESNAPIPKNIERIIRERDLKHMSVAKKAGYSVQQFSCMLNFASFSAFHQRQGKRIYFFCGSSGRKEKRPIAICFNSGNVFFGI